MSGGPWVAVAVAVGGALGSLARHFTVNGLAAWLGRTFPYGTLAVNVTGSFLMGLALSLLVQRGLLGEPWRAGLIVGVLGGFTTFSAFSIETVNLMIEGALAKAAINMAASLGLCVAATWIGLIAGRNL